MKRYFENVLNFFSSVICALCSPLARNYFELRKGNFYIRVSPRTCRGLYRWFTFAAKMIKIFNTIIFPLVEFIKCGSNKMEDPHSALFLISNAHEKKMNEIKICYEDPTVSDKVCQKKCTPTFGNFTIKFGFIRNYKQALKSETASN